MLVALCIALLAVAARCQSKASNDNSSELEENMDNRDSSDVCTGDNCQHFGVIIGSVIGAHVVLILLIIGLICCWKRCKGKLLQSNSRYVFKTKTSNTDLEMHGLSLFQTGLWTIRYHQNKTWYRSYSVSLSFDSLTSKVTGTGSDDFGSYTLDGTYSIRTCRIDLTKVYQSSMVNESVTVQLIWNEKSGQFEGKWYGKTRKFHGEDKFELKFEDIQPSLTNEEHIDA